MVVVLGHGDDVTLRRDLEAAATGHLDVRADEVRHKLENQICFSIIPDYAKKKQTENDKPFS